MNIDHLRQMLAMRITTLTRPLLLLRALVDICQPNRPPLIPFRLNRLTAIRVIMACSTVAATNSLAECQQRVRQVSLHLILCVFVD